MSAGDRGRSSILTIVGPTASGKSALAMKIAHSTPKTEILSADSRQIYRYLDIGTAKPTPLERAEVPHHGIDLIYPDQRYSAGQYADYARQAIRDLLAADRTPIVVGGTGFYVKALYDGLGAPELDPAVVSQLEQRMEQEGPVPLLEELREVDPEAATGLQPSNRRRIIRRLACFRQTGKPFTSHREEGREFEYRPQYRFLLPDRQELYRAIEERVDRMIEEGLLDEIEGILKMGYGPDDPALDSVGYRQGIAHLRGDLSLEEFREQMKRDTRRYAKRQLTWFRRVQGEVDRE